MVEILLCVQMLIILRIRSGGSVHGDDNNCSSSIGRDNLSPSYYTAITTTMEG